MSDEKAIKLEISECKFKYTEEEIKNSEYPLKNNPSWNENDYGRINENEFIVREDYCIWGLEKFFEEPTLEKSLLLLKIILEASGKNIALYQPNKSQERKAYPSQVIHQLRKLRWIPDKIGDFHKPSDISRSMIHEEFEPYIRKDWFKEIGLFDKEDKEKSAKILGFTMEEVELFTKYKEIKKLESKNL